MLNIPNFNLITMRELAKAINKPVSTVYEWRRDKKIPEDCFKIIGKSIFIRVDKITEFFNK